MDYSTIPTIDIICCTEKCTELEKCIEINSTLEEMKIDFDRQDKISIVSVIKGVTRNKTIKSLTLKHFASLPGGLIEQFLKDKDTLQALSLDFLYHFLPSSNIEVNTPLNALEVGVWYPSFSLSEQEPYAELWMGTHIKGPSIVSYPPSINGLQLSKCVINPGPSQYPTKDHAHSLHSNSPQYYPDSNHKPELVIALNNFEGLCGFRPFEEIRNFVVNVPELQTVLGDEIVQQMTTPLSSVTSNDLLKNSFTKLMNQDQSIVEQELDKLRERLKQEKNGKHTLYCCCNVAK
ncbi:PREDICTED: mannose-6-phosphate isomerase-like [Amphimedon queenslandica]|uniref:Phosphomannose isomerase type I catalytic domain-containing protein n=1 Tax=Amphimedon queenslandica TaxID=400682 RepID=A0AAN0JY53_AMPQE|nr:PREDICTED: mannose-6-phosphate isomerase-like [Amphimedon queenslandica]|eukprot:XP_019861884.1 PREDICTED: mannose-6-phosphate isomerase-like [Amphimedon queenslandica]